MPKVRTSSRPIKQVHRFTYNEKGEKDEYTVDTAHRSANVAQVMPGPKRLVPLSPMSIPTPKHSARTVVIEEIEDIMMLKAESALSFADIEGLDEIEGELMDDIIAGVAIAGNKYDVEEPMSYNEAVSCRQAEDWKEKMNEEWNSLVENDTFTLCMLPPDRKAVNCKWVYKVKRMADGSIDRLKARLCAVGTSQKEGIDYNDTFAPVVRIENLRTILSIGAMRDMEIHQMDVNSAFLNGILKEEIYMKQPPGFVSQDLPNAVLRLKKSIYGLKQASRVWYQTLRAFLIGKGFTQSKVDSCIFYRNTSEGLVMIAVYVDDCCIVADKPLLEWAKNVLKEGFSMKDLGEAKSLLGMQVLRDRGRKTLRLIQGGIIGDVLNLCGMVDCNPISTPMEPNLKLKRNLDNPSIMTTFPYRRAIGMLLYLAVGTRPDIAFAVNYLSRFVTCYDESHWAAVKRLARYLKGTGNIGVTYNSMGNEDSKELVGFGDADWGNDEVDRKSVSGYVFFLGGGPISWKTRKQTTVALSTVEAEYLSATEATKQAVHHRFLLNELGLLDLASATRVYSDNKGCIALTENPVHHDRTKHFDIRHHFVRERVLRGEVNLIHKTSSEMIADILTKALPRVSFEKFRKYLCT